MWVVIVFFFCNLPRIVANIYESFTVDTRKLDIVLFCTFCVNNWLLTVNASVNFLIYSYRGKKFKEASNKIVDKLKKCLSNRRSTEEVNEFTSMVVDSTVMPHSTSI